jgi:hypothetical protein
MRAPDMRRVKSAARALKHWMLRTRTRLRRDPTRPNQPELPTADGAPYFWDACGPANRPTAPGPTPPSRRDCGTGESGSPGEAPTAAVRLDNPSFGAAAEALAATPIRSNAPGTDLMTADEVAREYRVKREWVYAHKHELGAQALGSGRKPRLRFRRARVEAFLTSEVSPMCPTVPLMLNAAQRRPRSPPREPVPLLPIRRTPR